MVISCASADPAAGTVALPATEVSTPKPPIKTEPKDLLMPLHMISDKMVPLLATRAPVITSNELSRLNPVALVATPDMAFKKLITIGMSLPPTGRTSIVPRTRLSSVLPHRAAMRRPGLAVTA